jgi:hypothetical protein
MSDVKTDTEQKPKTKSPFLEEVVNSPLVVVQDDMSFDPSQWADIDAANSDNTSAAEMQIPRIGIAQPTSPLLAAGTPGWKAGMLFDTISNDIITIEGKAPWLLSKGVDPASLVNTNFLIFVPIMKLPSEFVLWPTKEERQEGMKRYHWKTLDRLDPRVREGSWPPIGTFKEDGKAPPVTEHTNILGLGLNEDGTVKTGMILASFSRTSAKAGKKLSTACINQRSFGLPYWGMVHYLFTTVKTDGKNTYYIMQSAKGPTLMTFCNNNPAVFKTCFNIAKDLASSKEKQHKLLNASELDVHDEDIPMNVHDVDSSDANASGDPEF